MASPDVPRSLRLLLRLFPKEFRREYGDEFAEYLAMERERPGGARGLRFWASTSLDLARSAARVRLAGAAAGPRPAGDGGSRGRREIVGTLLQELRQALRSLAGAPGMAVLVVGTLSLGIGMNSAIFSVVDAVLLEPLDYERPDRLVYVGARLVTEEIEERRHPGALFAELRRRARSFDDVAAVTTIRQNLTGLEVPLQAQVGWASANLFELLGVRAALGRVFADGDPPGTLLLSHGLWSRDFGSDPGVVGRSVSLDGYAYTIAGVLPAGFALRVPDFPRGVEVWKVPDTWWQNGDLWGAEELEFGILHVIARLAPGASPGTAAAEMESFSAGLRERYPLYGRVGLELTVTPLQERVVGAVRPTLLTLLGSVALVLLVACANVSNLLLVRAEGRRKELALRAALGCSRARIARLLLLESMTLALAGGVGGVLLGAAGTRLLRVLAPGELPGLDGVALDGTVLAFALAVSLLCTLLVGLAPALGAAARDLTADMREGRVTAGPSRQRAGRVLAVGQIAVSMVLLTGAGLLARSLGRLAVVDPGFRSERLLSFAVSLPGRDYERPVGTDRFLRSFEQRIEALPGARSAGVVWPLPLDGRIWSGHYSGGAVAASERSYAGYRVATPDYFETMGIRFVDGRSFREDDGRHVVVVSRRLAERAWPDVPAVGRPLRADPWGGDEEAFTVVGVVEDVRSQLREPPEPMIYFDTRGWSWTDWEMNVVVRTAAAPLAFVEPIRDELLAMDARIPMAQVRAMSDYLDQQLAGTRFALALVGLFAVVAAALSLVGVAGVVSYSVSQRTREFGLRMALGARRSRILGLVLGRAAGVAALGVAIGLLGSLWGARLLSALLFDVRPTDPATLGVVTAALALATVAAAGAPALRATRVDPSRTLHSDG